MERNNESLALISACVESAPTFHNKQPAGDIVSGFFMLSYMET